MIGGSREKREICEQKSNNDGDKLKWTNNARVWTLIKMDETKCKPIDIYNTQTATQTNNL